MRIIGRYRDSNQCESVRPLLSPYMDRRTAAAETEQVERHLASCTNCQAELDQLEMLARGLRALPQVPVPRSFALRPTAVAAQPPRAAWPAGFAYLRRTAVALAACLVLMIGASAQLGRTYLPAYGLLASEPATYMAAQPEPADASEPAVAALAPNGARVEEPTQLSKSPLPPEPMPSPASAQAAPAAVPAPAPAPPGMPEKEDAAAAGALPAAPAPDAGVVREAARSDELAPPPTLVDAPAIREAYGLEVRPRWFLWEAELALAIMLLMVSVGAFLGTREPRG